MVTTAYSAGTITFLAVALAITIAISSTRLYILRNRCRSKAFLVSDALQALFLLEAVGLGACVVYQVAEIDMFEQSTSDEMAAVLHMFSDTHMKLYYVEASGLVVILWTVKASFVALYWGLGNRLTMRMKTALWLLTAFVGATGVINLGLYLGWCQPLHLNWEYQTAACNPAVVNPDMVTVLFATNAATHILLMLFPLGLLKNYSIARQQLWAIIFMVFCGAFGLFLIITRYAIMRSLIFDELKRPLYVRCQQLLGVAELFAVNIAFCFPAYRMAIFRWFQKRRSRKSRRRSKLEQRDGRKHLEIHIQHELEINVQVEMPEDSAAGVMRALGLLGLGLGESYTAEAVALCPPKPLGRGDEDYMLGSMSTRSG